MAHKKYRKEKNCLNCGAEVQQHFCSQCGQENVELRDGFFHMVNHFVSDYFHFDSKFLRSLKPLFTRPGFLTQEYWEGRRARYIAPVRLFFFVTIVFMLFTSYAYNRNAHRVKNYMINNSETVGGYDSTEIFSMHDTAHVKLRIRKDTTITAKALKEKYIENVVEFNQIEASVDFVFKNLKYVTFFLLPVYAAWIRLFYGRSRPYYIDHVIFTMHLQTFIYLIGILIFIAGIIWPPVFGVFTILLVTCLFVYLLLSLRSLYRQNWLKTLLRALLVSVILVLTTSFTIVGLTLIDAFLLH